MAVIRTLLDGEWVAKGYPSLEPVVEPEPVLAYPSLTRYPSTSTYPSEGGD